MSAQDTKIYVSKATVVGDTVGDLINALEMLDPSTKHNLAAVGANTHDDHRWLRLYLNYTTE